MRRLERRGNTDGGLSMFDALLRDQIERHGSGQKGYAEHLGVNEQTVSRWIRRITNPLANNYKESKRLTDDLNYNVTTLRQLGSVGVAEASRLVLEKIGQIDSKEEVLKDRFIDLVSERGSAAIPTAVFAIFLTSDDYEERLKVVEILEQNAEKIPLDISVEALRFAMSL